jgi:hypothetical protein
VSQKERKSGNKFDPVSSPGKSSSDLLPQSDAKLGWLWAAMMIRAAGGYDDGTMGGGNAKVWHQPKLKMFALPPEPDDPILKAIDFIYKLVVLFLRFLMLEDRFISVKMMRCKSAISRRNRPSEYAPSRVLVPCPPNFNLRRYRGRGIWSGHKSKTPPTRRLKAREILVVLISSVSFVTSEWRPVTVRESVWGSQKILLPGATIKVQGT